jgi:hypothetical protein
MDNSLFQLAQGRTDGLTGRIDVNRPLLHGSVFHISYSTWHQSSRGNLLIPYNLDRNQIAVGFNYQMKALPFGR